MAAQLFEIRSWDPHVFGFLILALGACSAVASVDLPRSEPEAELPPPEQRIQLKENNASHLQLLGVIQKIGR
jgi:hypothetical protein